MALGIVIVLILPQFRSSWSRLQMEQTAFELAQTLRAARVVAITESQPVEWVWESEGRRVWLGRSTEEGSLEPIAGRLGHVRRVPEPVEVSVVRDEAPVDRVSFFPDGTSQATTLLVGNQAAPRYAISVDATTGQVAVEPASLLAR